MTDKAREAAARALSKLHIEASLEKGSGWRVAAHRGANAAIDAYLVALGETHAVVPREATEAMHLAFNDVAIREFNRPCFSRTAYRAMLKAAEPQR